MLYGDSCLKTSKVKIIKKVVSIWRKCISTYDRVVNLTIKSLEDCHLAKMSNEKQNVMKELKDFYKSCYGKMVDNREVLLEAEKCVASTIATSIDQPWSKEMFKIINSIVDYAGLDENLDQLNIIESTDALKRAIYVHDIYIQHLNMVCDKLLIYINKHQKEIEETKTFE